MNWYKYAQSGDWAMYFYKLFRNAEDNVQPNLSQLDSGLQYPDVFEQIKRGFNQALAAIQSQQGSFISEAQQAIINAINSYISGQEFEMADTGYDLNQDDQQFNTKVPQAQPAIA